MADIAFISTYPELTRQVTEVVQETGEKVKIVEGLLEHGVDLGKNLEKVGSKVLISRGGTVLMLQSQVHIPVIEIPITGYDLAKALKEAKQYGDRIGMISFQNMFFQVEDLADLFEVEITKIHLAKDDQAEKVISTLSKDEFDVLVGGVVTVQNAIKYGFNSVFIRSGKNGVYQAIAEAKRILQIRLKEMKRTKIFQTILDYTNDGILVFDQSGELTTYNQKMQEILNVQEEELHGEDLKGLISPEKFRNLQTGSGEYDRIEKIRGKTLAVNRIPLEVGNKVSGLVVTCQDVTYIQDLEYKVRREILSKGLTAKHTFNHIIGESAEIQQTITKAKRFSQVDSNILIYGETGTGKEVIAQSIHSASDRRQDSFVAVNCAALPENLLESELFGYAPGAFTGAIKEGKQGLFELAHGGTIFLDEVSEMSAKLQARLLRVLQEREVRRIGDDRVIHVDLRVIAASNRDLAELVREGEFREDLLYRLDILRITLPPLRQRTGDIQLLVEHFIKQISQRMGRTITGISSGGLRLLEEYYWPGNIRQLANVIEQSIVLTEDGQITDNLLREILLNKKPFCPKTKGIAFEDDAAIIERVPYPDQEIETLTDMLTYLESVIIHRFLSKNQGNQKKTAEELGIDRSTLWRKLNR